MNKLFNRIKEYFTLHHYLILYYHKDDKYETHERCVLTVNGRIKSIEEVDEFIYGNIDKLRKEEGLSDVYFIKSITKSKY